MVFCFFSTWGCKGVIFKGPENSLETKAYYQHLSLCKEDGRKLQDSFILQQNLERNNGFYEQRNCLLAAHNFAKYPFKKHQLQKWSPFYCLIFKFSVWLTIRSITRATCFRKVPEIEIGNLNCRSLDQWHDHRKYRTGKRSCVVPWWLNISTNRLFLSSLHMLPASNCRTSFPHLMK